MRIREIAAGLAALCVASSALAGNLVEVTPVADTLVPIDNPATNRWPKNAFARGVLDLQFYHGRLFNGGGETETNPGPTWIHSIDPDLLATKFEYSAGTEAIANFKIASWGDLYTPAQDPREGDEHEGSVFKRTADGVWSRHGGIPGGNAKNGNSTVAYNTHVWDTAEFDGRIFTTGYGLCWSTNRFASFVDATPTWTDVHQSLQYWSKSSSANKTTLSLLRRQVHFLQFPGDLFAVPNTWADAYRVRETQAEVHHYNPTTKTFDAVPQYASTLFPGISLSDFALVFPAGKTATTNGYVRVWHPTSFKDRVLYVTSLDYQTPAVKDAYTLTSYPLPLFGCTAKVSNGKISAARLSFDGEYPWDFLVRGGTVYALTSKYVADGKKARHSVWKSTDGQNFTRLFTFDYHQHFISLEYRDGWFYFGAGVKSATKGDTYDSQADESGLICRAWHPVEPLRVIASKEDAVWNEGSSKTFGFRLSSAPATNLTLRVVARGSRAVTLDKTELTFTPSNWSAVQTVQATLVNDAANDSSAVAIVCGAKGDDIELGALASPEVTGACVRETPADDDVAPAVTSESFAYAVEPVTYTVTLDDFGRADGFAASSAALVGTVYGDAARTNVIARQEKTVSASGVATTLAFNTLTRGAAGYFVAELKTSPTIVREFATAFIAPLGTASDLTDLMDDLTIRGENLSANGTTGDTNGDAAYDNNVTGTGRAQFGGYNKPAYFVYNFSTPQIVNGFGVMSVVENGGNPDRHPNSINLYASSDGSTWTKLFAAPTQTDWSYSEWRRFTVPNETAYAYYKLEIASGIQWTLIQEAELYHIAADPEAGNGDGGTGNGEEGTGESGSGEGTPVDVSARMEFWANPAASWWPNAEHPRDPMDLQTYQGRIYTGEGDWTANTGPTPILSMDVFTPTYENEYTSRADGLDLYRVLGDGSLYLPGSDYMDDHNGVYYRKDAVTGEWSMHWVGEAGFTHNLDVCSVGDAVFFGGDAQIVASRDGYATHASVRTIGRVTFLLPFDDAVYTCNVDARWKDAYLTNDYSGSVMITKRPGEIIWFRMDAQTFAGYTNETVKTDQAFDDVFQEEGDRAYAQNEGAALVLRHVMRISGNRCLAVAGSYACWPFCPYGLVVMREEGKTVKGTRVRSIPVGTYPWDLITACGRYYTVASTYDAANRCFINSVWESADGETFTELFNFSAPSIARSFEYADGHFYFGIGDLEQGDLFPTTRREGESFRQGDVYRVAWTLEPTSVVLTHNALTVAEGASATLGVKLSAAPASNTVVRLGTWQAKRDVTFTPSTLTFTPSNWNVRQDVTVALPEDSSNDPEDVLVLAGAPADANGKSAFVNESLRSAQLTLTPVENDVAAAIASEALTFEPDVIAYTVALSDFGKLNGASATSAAVSLEVFDAAGASVAVTNGTLAATGTTLTLSLAGVGRAAQLRAVATVRTFPSVARVLERTETTPLATASELVDLMDDESIRGTEMSASQAAAGNKGARAYDNNTTDSWSQFGGYSKPDWFIYQFTKPQIVNGVGIEGCVGGNASWVANQIWLYGSSDNATWTELLHVTGQDAWGEGEWRRYLSANTNAYTYYKVAIKNDIYQNVYIQEAELYSIKSLIPESGNGDDPGTGEPGTGNGGDDPVVPPVEPVEEGVMTRLGAKPEGAVDLTTATAWDDNVVSGDKGAKAGGPFDDDFSTSDGRWLVQSKTCQVTYHFASNAVVNALGIWDLATGYGADYYPAERAPKDFEMLGSVDGTTWTTLAARTNETGWDAGESRFYSFANTNAYAYYRFKVNANNGNNYTLIHELEFYGAFAAEPGSGDDPGAVEPGPGPSDDEPVVEPGDFAALSNSMSAATLVVRGLADGVMVTDLPVLVRVSSIPGLADAPFGSTDGADLLFVDADDRPLASEIDTWTATEKLVWVKLPTATNGTKFRAVWGSDRKAVDTSKDVWSSYVAVWHLNDLKDSTASRYDLSSVNVGTSVCTEETKKNVGSCWTIAPSGSTRPGAFGLFARATTNLVLGTAFTVSGWLRHEGTVDWDHAFYRKNGASNDGGFSSEIYQGTLTKLTVYGGSNVKRDITLPDSANAWIHLALAYAGTTVTTFANGAQAGSGSVAAPTDNGLPLSFGNNYNPSTGAPSDYFWIGQMDELRVRKTTATAQEMAAEYATVHDPDFLAYGPATTPDNPIDPSDDEPGTGCDDAPAVPVDAADRYVATSGNDGNDGLTPTTAKRTIAGMVSALAGVADPVTIHVADGVYGMESELTISSAISIIGNDADPGRVVISNLYDSGDSRQEQRVFLLDHADARLSGLTIAKGEAYNRMGGNVNISANGGTVTNCIITGGWARLNGQAAGVFAAAGLVTHCRISGNASGAASQSWDGNRAASCRFQGTARVEDCLFDRNVQAKECHLIVLRDSATMRNCTIVDSSLTAGTETAGGSYPLFVNGTSAVVENTVIAGVVDGNGAALGPKCGASVLSHCATDTAAPVNASCVIGTTGSLFVDYANGDYRPAGALVNAGVDGNLPATDLAGRNRKVGSHVDIGCYESQARVGFAVILECAVCGNKRK